MRAHSNSGAEHPFVMLVDDDAITADMYALYLRRAAFRVDVFPDAAALFDALEAEIPDALILDWELPLITGGDIFRVVRHTPRTARVPVLFLSNHSPGVISLSDQDEATWLVKAHTTPIQLASELLKVVVAPAA